MKEVLPGSILSTLENASSACSNEPYRSYKIPMPYHNFGSCLYQLMVYRDSDESYSSTDLGVLQMIKRLLIRRISLGQIILHQQTMSHRAPHLPIVLLDIEDPLEIVDGLSKVVLVARNVGSRVEGNDGIWVVSEGMLECGGCAIGVLHLFRYSACTCQLSITGQPAEIGLRATTDR